MTSDDIKSITQLIANLTTQKLFVLTLPLLLLIGLMGWMVYAGVEDSRKTREVFRQILDVQEGQAANSANFLKWIEEDERRDTQIFQSLQHWLKNNPIDDTRP